MKTVAVLQSNYIPWKGYFDLIHDVDEFIFYDDVQFTKNDWRNRNRVKTAQGTQWLTVPVGQSLDRLICEVELPSPSWQLKHWKTLEQNYRKAAHYEEIAERLQPFYLEQEWRTLSELNTALIRFIAEDLLEIKTQFTDSRKFELIGAKQERLLSLLKQAEATHYISGPAAKAYIQPEAFEELEIDLAYKDYSGYPEYPQPHPPFEHGVTILDLLFSVGQEKATEFIWDWRERTASF